MIPYLRRMRHFFILWGLLTLSFSSYAVMDTLYHYDKSSGNSSYSITKLQVARMEPAAPCTLHSVIVTLIGLGGDFNLRIFGHEAGTSFPQLEEDLITPINIVKANTGIEVVTIVLDTPLYIPNNQFFTSNFILSLFYLANNTPIHSFSNFLKRIS